MLEPVLPKREGKKLCNIIGIMSSGKYFKLPYNYYPAGYLEVRVTLSYDCVGEVISPLFFQLLSLSHI